MKKIIIVIGIVVFGVVMLFNVSLNKKSNLNTTDLSQLMKTNEANAECMPFFVAHSVCVIETCYFSPFPDDVECDPMQ